MSRNRPIWTLGQATIGTAVRALAPLRVYGAERVPEDGGVVLVFNHFSWLDPPAFGAASPRQLYFLAKAELHQVPVVGPLIKAFGTYSVRRGQSDREAVREMRRCVQEGNALGVFAEGTRQRSGVPGEVMPGAAMVALNEQTPVVCAAIAPVRVAIAAAECASRCVSTPRTWSACSASMPI